LIEQGIRECSWGDLEKRADKIRTILQAQRFVTAVVSLLASAATLMHTERVAVQRHGQHIRVLLRKVVFARLKHV